MKKGYAILIGLALIGSIALAPQEAEAADYVVTDEASFNAFLAGIGGAGVWNVGLYSVGLVYSGTLPAGSTLTMNGAASLRVQDGPFTNNGVITINSTELGYYGAGVLVNNGTLNIVAGTPSNFGSISNSGQFNTAVDFYNHGSITNLCGGTTNGVILVNSPITDCPTPTQASSWGRVKAHYR